jgi:hypothetical protein
MGVNQRHAHIVVAQQFSDSLDVIAIRDFPLAIECVRPTTALHRMHDEGT